MRPRAWFNAPLQRSVSSPSAIVFSYRSVTLATKTVDSSMPLGKRSSQWPCKWAASPTKSGEPRFSSADLVLAPRRWVLRVQAPGRGSRRRGTLSRSARRRCPPHLRTLPGPTLRGLRGRERREEDRRRAHGGNEGCGERALGRMASANIPGRCFHQGFERRPCSHSQLVAAGVSGRCTLTMSNAGEPAVGRPDRGVPAHGRCL